MRLHDINLKNYESLEDCCLDIEKKAKPNSEDAINELRYQVFSAWHDEIGFSPQDTEFVRVCRFDVDCFKSKEEIEEYEKQIKKETSQYRHNRDKTTADKEEYISNKAKLFRKNIMKAKGTKISKEELLRMLKKEHENEVEIYTAITTADEILINKLAQIFAKERAERIVENEDRSLLSNDEYKSELERFVETHKTVERLMKEVTNLEGDVFDKRLLRNRVEEYIENGGFDARIALQTSEDEFIEKASTYVEKNKKELFIGLSLGLLFTNMALLAFRYILCIIKLDRFILSTNPLYIMFSVLLSVGTWMLLTTKDYFNYHKRKWRMTVLVCINIGATLLQVAYTAIWDFCVVNIFKIPTNTLFTPSMVLTAARIVVILCLALGAYIIYKIFRTYLPADEVKEKVLTFKITHHVDTREYKDNKYDFVATRDLTSGKVIAVKENDLFTHVLMIGASGTGKSSSVFLPQIITNIEQKIRNVDAQQREVLKMVRNGDVKVIAPFPNGRFHKNCFRVTNPAKQKQFDSIFKRHENCGITVVAPNNSLNEDILTYASGRGITVYNIDPTKDKPTHKYEKLVGMNPVYVPPRFHYIKVGDAKAEAERNIYIAQAANNFADTLTAINELNGSGDQYFTDVNTTVTSAITTVLMLDASIRNIQVTIEDVYNCIINFSLLVPVVNNIKSHFDIKYQAEEEEKKRKGALKPDRRRTLHGLDDEDGEENEMPPVHHALADTDRKNPYLQTIITVESRLQKGSKMDEHAEGLRNLLGKILQDPRVKNVLVNNPEIIDFNTILSDNCITLINTGGEMGNNTSTCFGQLFILNFNTAVLRRPKDTRTPHFFYEDETARYLSGTIDTMVTLYRQYRVACMFALQSLDQIEAVKKLAYLKNVLLSVGTIIAFGRASYQDAKQISDLSGQVRYMMEQNTTSRTSITAENAATSYSTRTTPDTKNYLDPSDIRTRDFQECTIIATDNGRVMPGRLAKVFFVPKDIIDAKSKAHIKRQGQWDTVWNSHYPLLEDTMAITTDSTTPSNLTAQMAKELVRRSDKSVTFEREGDEKRQFDSLFQQNGDVATMAAILNSVVTQPSDMTNDEMLGQLGADNEWDEDDFDDIEDDDDFDFINPAMTVTVSSETSLQSGTEGKTPAGPQTDASKDAIRRQRLANLKS